MPSSLTRPGPHDRKPGVPRQQCIALNRVNGKRCRRWTTRGKTKLCRLHYELAQRNPDFKEAPTKLSAKAQQAFDRQARADPDDPNQGVSPRSGVPPPEGSLSSRTKAGVVMNLRKKIPSVTAVVINAQSRQMLERLGKPYDPNDPHQHHADPKQVLLNVVTSAWLQVQVWQAVLAAIPEEDFAKIGMTPIPGNEPTSRGARIEAIQKFLLESTKVAARTSKLAIDAGIEERLVRIAEEQQALIADTVRAGLIAGISALARSGLISPDAEAAAIQTALGSAANHLRQLAAGGPEVVEGVAKVIVNKTDARSQRAAGYRERDRQRTRQEVIEEEEVEA